MGAPVTQFQMFSKKPDETAEFYCTLFEWTVDTNNPLGYRPDQYRIAAGNSGWYLAGAGAGPQLCATVHDRE